MSAIQMPWASTDAKRFTRKAMGGKPARQWSHVANSMLSRGLSEGSAVRAANSVVKRRSYYRGKRRA